MSVAATIRQSSALGGVSFPESRTISGDAQIVQSPSIPAAEDGELTTRTDDTTGQITMDDSAHIVQTGDRIDLYWANGQRRGVVAGTVTTFNVPVSGGKGDPLPTASTDIIVAVAVEIDIFVDGDNVDAALVSSPQKGQVVFIDIDVSEQEIFNWFLGVGDAKTWHDENGEDNPFAGANIGRAYMTHNLTTAAVIMNLGLVYNNVAG